VKRAARLSNGDRDVADAIEKAFELHADADDRRESQIEERKVLEILTDQGLNHDAARKAVARAMPKLTDRFKLSEYDRKKYIRDIAVSGALLDANKLSASIQAF
jgi:hypothetical protein